MLLGLADFDVDIFLRFDDSNVAVYYTDFDTIPELAGLIPLGSFDDDQKFLLRNLDIESRVRVGLLFLERDLYAEYNFDEEKLYIRMDRIYEEFRNIPEVVQFCEKYTKRCDEPVPPTWCMDCGCDECLECPGYCEGDKPCAIRIPVSEFYGDDPTDPEKYYEDLYYLTIVYFNGIYRTVPDSIMNYATYDMFTDIDFELNKYSMIIDLKEFFTKEFIYFLKSPPGSLPFANDYGTHIKYVVQTKNTDIQRIEVENEINFFIMQFNLIYGQLVKIKSIEIEQNYSDIGADSWVIAVYADVQKERLTYRLVI